MKKKGEKEKVEKINRKNKMREKKEKYKEIKRKNCLILYECYFVVNLLFS